jgi:hypothetical protein
MANGTLRLCSEFNESLRGQIQSCFCPLCHRSWILAPATSWDAQGTPAFNTAHQRAMISSKAFGSKGQVLTESCHSSSELRELWEGAKQLSTDPQLPPASRRS